MLLNLIIATVILVAVFVGMFQVQRWIKGDASGLALKRPSKRKDPTGPNELEAFIETYRRDPIVVSALGESAVTAVAPAPSPVGAMRRRAQFLAGPHKLTFLVLKTALPDYHVFATLRLADVLELEAGSRVAARAVDFLVCSKDMSGVAVVLIERVGTSTLTRDTEARVRSAGLRCVRLQPPDIPRPAEMRRLVLGA